MNNEQPSFRNEIDEPAQKERRGLVAMAIIGIILGLIIGYFVFSLGIFSPKNADLKGQITSSTTPITLNNNSLNNNIGLPSTGTMEIVADDQNPGDRLSISKMNIAEGAWVVTFTSTEDKSAPERIIGAQYFNAGSYNNVTAYLGESTIAGETYFVTFYRDDAVRGTTTAGGHIFNSVTDRPILKNGNWILDSFVVSSVGSRG
ncbi:MAG: hypothetical protein AAB821_00265 [Patescibacteria group bacterium]